MSDGIRYRFTGDDSNLQDALSRINRSFQTTERNSQRLNNALRTTGAAMRVPAAGASEGAQQLARAGQATRELTKDTEKLANSQSGMLAVFKNSFSFLRTAANVLPGLGLSGLILLIAQGIGEIAKQFSKATNEVNKLKEASSILKEAYGGSEFKDAFVQIRTLTAQIGLARQGFIDKEKALLQYNKTLGESIGKAQSLQAAEQLLIDKGEAFIQVQLLKSAASLAYSKAADEALKAAIKEKEFLEKYGDLLNETRQPLLDEQGRPILSLRFEEEAIEAEVKGRINEERRRMIETNQKRIQSFVEIGNDFMRQMAEIASQFKIDIFPKVEIKKEKAKEIEFPKVEFPKKLKIPIFQQISVDAENLTGVIDKIKELDAQIKRLSSIAVPGFSLSDQINALKELKAQLESIVPAIRKPAELRGFESQIQSRVDAIIKKMKDLEEAEESLAEQTRANLASIAESFAQGLGDAIVFGDIGRLFQPFIDSLSSAIQEIGKQLIKLGVVALKIQVSLQNLFKNPIMMVAAGAALVAVGAAMRSALSRGIRQRATGGPVPGGTSVLVGERGPEIFRPATAGMIVPSGAVSPGQAIPVVNIHGKFIIDGQKLRLVLERADSYQRRNV